MTGRRAISASGDAAVPPCRFVLDAESKVNLYFILELKCVRTYSSGRVLGKANELKWLKLSESIVLAQ